MAQVAMPAVDALREKFVEPVRDLKINLGNIASSDHLDADQIWGLSIACAIYLGQPELTAALLEDAKTAAVSDDLIDDARSAAAIMGMNTVYYRFRHMIGKESYGQKPARLRMQAMARPKTGKANYELFSLGVAVLAGCEACIKAHEASIQQHGLTEEHAHDAVRLAAILGGSAVAIRASS